MNRIACGTAVLAGIALSFLATCNAHVGASLQATVATASSGVYAAMDEIPVTGGELRLVTARTEIHRGVERRVIAFPLIHTAITAEVAGEMGVYQIEQIFENPFDEPIEAVYVFPLGDQAAVSGYQIVIGERTIDGEIRTRGEAQQVYAAARAAGHTAAILEQERPNVFAQRIANITPRERIRVRITYVELVDHVEGGNQLAVPLVVGPRYLPAGAAGPRQPSSYLDATRDASTVSLAVEIEGGMPITDVESTSHDIAVEDVSPTRTRVTLARGDEVPNRDVVLRYQIAGPRTTVGLLAHRTDDDGYFVLTVQPKASYRTGDVLPREVVLLIDRSGSMDGAPLAQAKALAHAVIDSLSDRDTFNVLSFSSDLSAMGETPIAGDAAGKARGHDHVDGLGSGGGTEMQQGILGALATPAADDRIRIVYFLSDGLVGNDDVVIGAARDMLGHNRIFPVGIGSSPNRYLLDHLAEVGRGFASYLGLTESADDLAPSLVRRSAFPYLTDVAIDWGELEVADVSPAVIPDVYAGIPVIVSGRYRRAGRGTVTVTATVAGGLRTTIPLEVQLPERLDLEPVAALWARRQIEALFRGSREAGSRDVEDEVTALALRFHLVTQFTAFVAVDRSRVVGSPGEPRTIEQPAVLPEGMSPAVAPPAPAPAPPPPAPVYHESDSGGGGGGWSGGWSSGGGEEGDPWRTTLLGLLALLPILWLVLRRCVG